MQLLGWVHILLNLSGLLLWLKWRELMLQSARRPVGTTLISTLRRAGGAPAHRWAYLAGLLGLLFLRAVGYQQMGPAARWTPTIDMVAIVLPFRCDMLSRMLLFSLINFVVFVAEFYFCLLLLSAANRKISDTDPIQNQIRAHLGKLERLPAILKILLPFLVAGLFWLALGPFLAWLGLLPTLPKERVFRQAAYIGLVSILIWRYLIAGILLLHLVTSYVFFGNAALWSFINLTAPNLLKPIRWLPLKFGKIDLAPLVGGALVLALGQVLIYLLTPVIGPARPSR